MLDYGFNLSGGLVVHIERQTIDDVEEDRVKINRAFKDPRFKPGKTFMLMHYNSKIPLDVHEIAECARAFTNAKLRCMATVTHDSGSHAIMQQFTGFVRDRGTPAKEFQSLDGAMGYIADSVNGRKEVSAAQ